MSSNSGSDYKEYAKARNQAKNEIRKSIKPYKKATVKEVLKNPKKFWGYMTSKTNTNNSIPQLQKDDGRTTINNLDKANSMNDYFCSVFTRERGKPPTSERREYACKTMDSIIREHLIHHMMTNNLFANQQHGFPVW